jgi:N-methylhydantoinase A/oxoprolinase/acetone carboxylase beta subunit
MVQAIELNSVRRGYDPRDFALVAFGGAGPLFACDIARELAIPRVVVPSLPGLTSALGLLASDVSYDFGRTLMITVRDADLDRIARCYAELEAQANAQLARDGFGASDMLLLRVADCRYAGQGYELRTAAPAGAIDAGFLAGLTEAFHAEHRRQYGSSFADKPVQLVNARVVGLGRIPALRAPAIAVGGAVPASSALIGTREVVFEEAGRPRRLATRCWRRAKLEAGNQLEGPAIVEQMDSTTVIPPGLRACVDAYGNLVIELS